MDAVRILEYAFRTMQRLPLTSLLAGMCLALTTTACPHNRPPSSVVTLDPGRCTPITAQQKSWLGPEWERFAGFARACEVKRGDSSPLYVFSVWARDFEATLPKDAPAEPLPKPVIAAQDGKVLGHLPLGFPDDPPRSSDVSFSDWLNGFPRRVTIAVTDPTVLGNRTLVMEWDPHMQSYVSKKPSKQGGKENR